MVVVGAERGADEAFDELNAMLLSDSSLPLPEAQRSARRLWPEPFTEGVRKRVHQAIVEEYGQEQAYINAYEDQLQERYSDLDKFMGEIAELVLIGAENGADDMLCEIYKSFLFNAPLPPARRHPKRLKGKPNPLEQ